MSHWRGPHLRSVGRRFLDGVFPVDVDETNLSPGLDLRICVNVWNIVETSGGGVN